MHLHYQASEVKHESDVPSRHSGLSAAALGLKGTANAIGFCIKERKERARVDAVSLFC